MRATLLTTTTIALVALLLCGFTLDVLSAQPTAMTFRLPAVWAPV